MVAPDALLWQGFSKRTVPLSWSYGQAKPMVNEYSRKSLSFIFWVERPVGTGFSQGTPNIENEDQLSEQLVGFMQQFLAVFSELKVKKLWLERVYVPYIVNHIYENSTLLDLSLQGI
ncbi:hypothetical protein PAXINDRAFT_14263 [Paxillus involutus ATCC 200175]|uniref:Uncharacterized protein n=1 Tax=Paxillus involutus ATCC 200175 TaxID=664439 RepID=A0A0C9TBD0_PAXIN|nr:hypothetical protein PAXINDRAFT_14263 [Paxillus involutus ATCC 200175]